MKKKVLFLCADYERGGIPRVTLNLVTALQQHGEIVPSVFVEILVVCFVRKCAYMNIQNCRKGYVCER